jgi:hypothetical protein
LATGRMNSTPAPSAMSEILTISSHSARHRSGAVLTVKPPSQLALNSPSLNRLEPRMGLANMSKASFPRVGVDHRWDAAAYCPDFRGYINGGAPVGSSHIKSDCTVIRPAWTYFTAFISEAI